MSNSNQQSQSQSYSSYTSFSSSSYTSTSTSAGAGGGQPHTQTYTERTTYNSRDGGTIEREAHETGRASLIDTQHIAPQGQGNARLEGSGSGARRIEDVTDRDDDGGQAQRDREYEEKMEEEYAKREGGA